MLVDETVSVEGPIEPPQPDLVPKDPIKIGGDLEFVDMNMEDEAEVQEVYELLSGHYVEDDDATFRFAYSASFLKWYHKLLSSTNLRAMLTPDYCKAWHVGLRATHNDKRKLCAFISGIPITLRIRNNTIKTVEINFLCIHKKLRSKRLTPVLIKEITRRCHLQGIWDAVYTVGMVLPRPIATCRYYHRALNWMKLYETGFSPLPFGSTTQRMVLRNQLRAETELKGLRLMEANDVEQVTTLLQQYLAKFDLAPVYSEEEVRHWFLHHGDERVIWTYVVEVNPLQRLI
jgi:glycylpeptide N-tetradecanoyltransferase